MILDNAMKRDSWFHHDDFLARLEPPHLWLEGMIPVEEVVRTYVEDLTWWCVPVSTRSRFDFMADHTWGDILSHRRLRLIRRTSSDFLSRAVRRHLGLDHGTRSYLDDTGTVVAERRDRASGYSDHKLVTMRSDTFDRLLKACGPLRALWCFKSYRFSERTLAEHGLKPIAAKVIRKENCIYSFNRFATVPSPLSGRSRMKSGTIVFGKLLTDPG